MNRNLVLWVTLLIATRLLYGLFGDRPYETPRWLPAALVLGLIVWLAIPKRDEAHIAGFAEAGLLFERGRYLEALARYEALRKTNPAWAEYGVAIATASLWRLNEADAALERTLKTKNGKQLKQQVVDSLRLVAALRGDRVRTEQLRLRATASQGHLVPVLAAVWNARDLRWSELRSGLTMEQIRPLSGQNRALAESLNSWAVEQLEHHTPRIDYFGVVGEANLDAVRKYWPEFAAFLERAAKSNGE